MRAPKLTRATILCGSGLSGLAYMLLNDVTERPTLIVACLALCGVPFLMSSDEKKSDEKKEPKP